MWSASLESAPVERAYVEIVFDRVFHDVFKYRVTRRLSVGTFSAAVYQTELKLCRRISRACVAFRLIGLYTVLCARNNGGER